MASTEAVSNRDEDSSTDGSRAAAGVLAEFRFELISPNKSATAAKRLVEISLSLQTFGHVLNRCAAREWAYQKFQAPALRRENTDVPKWNRGAARLFVLTLVAELISRFAQESRG